MASRAAAIERYLREELRKNPDGLEIRRRDLAERFGCVPSQISYVLATRFNLANGYLVESRRGGGGFIRIRPLSPKIWHLLRAPEEVRPLGQEEAWALVDRLRSEGFLSPREAAIIRAALDRSVLGLESSRRDILRARLLRAMFEGLVNQLERG